MTLVIDSKALQHTKGIRKSFNERKGVQSLARVSVLCPLVRNFTLTVPLSTQEELVILLVASVLQNWDKL